MGGFPYGAVYKVQREHTLQDIYGYLQSIKNLGLNFVVIWPAVYWWEDKNNEYYPFNTGRQILKYAEEIGLKIIMELAGQITSLEYAPDFVMKEEYLVCDENGHYTEFRGGYSPINFNHPEVKDIIRKSFVAAADNYKGFSSLYGYDIWNETQFTSYDKYTLKLFQDWLRGKYETLDRLNASWDRAYTHWEQICFTKWLWASIMPEVDFQEFKKENIGFILKEWGGYVKSSDSQHPVIADNVESMVTGIGYDRPHDDWNIAENTDETGMSFYPSYFEPSPAWERWENLIGFHSASRNGRFWIAEMQTHTTDMFIPKSLVHPYELRWWNWEAISHGSKGIIYWKWHPFIRGEQIGGRGLTDARGDYTPRAYEAQSISRILQENAQEFNSYEPEQPRAAILYDRLCQEFNMTLSESMGQMYTDSIAGLYKCLWDLNIPAKFITPADIIKGKAEDYKILFLTNQLNIDDSLADGIRNYVKRGGILVTDGKTGEFSNEAILHKDLPGGPLNDILGCSYIDLDIGDMHAEINWDNERIEIEGCFEKRLMSINDKSIKVMGSFRDGYPALCCGEYGEGQIIQIFTHLWYGYGKNKNGADSIMKMLDLKYELMLHKISDNRLKISTIGGKDGLLLFVFNYEDEEIKGNVTIKTKEGGKYSIRNLYDGSSPDSSQSKGNVVFDVAVKGREVMVFSIKN